MTRTLTPEGNVRKNSSHFSKKQAGNYSDRTAANYQRTQSHKTYKKIM